MIIQMRRAMTLMTAPSGSKKTGDFISFYIALWPMMPVLKDTLLQRM